MKTLCLLAICAIPFAASAQDTPALQCHGQTPNWRLDIRDDAAIFVFPGKTEMTVKAETRVEGAAWPRALTLIGDRDTGILVLHHRLCGDAPFEAQMLTQRGQTPILLTGCCETQQ